MRPHRINERRKTIDAMSQQVAGYQGANDQVPEMYQDFFDNADWTLHKFTVAGSWSFLIVAVVAHILVWLWRPWIG